MRKISYPVDIDLEDLLDSLKTHEIQDVVEWLSESGYISEETDLEVINDDHYHLCKDLNSLYYQLTQEELELLQKIRNKYL